MKVGRLLLMGAGLLLLLWALSRIGREVTRAFLPPRENPKGLSFTMTRTFVCKSCGFTIPATGEEITRRISEGRVQPLPDGEQIYICDREGTPTMELVIDAKTRP